LEIFVTFSRLASSLPGSNQKLLTFRFSGRKETLTGMFKSIIPAEDCRFANYKLSLLSGKSQ